MACVAPVLQYILIAMKDIRVFLKDVKPYANIF